MKRYIVVDVGCIECGVDTLIVGVYTTMSEATSVANKRAAWRNSGQAYSEVFEVEI